MNDNCGVCGKPIRVQIQKNTGVCSQVCEKKADKQAINAVTE
jgi:predicted nucleic acid-binding Zn ribbon protein